MLPYALSANIESIKAQIVNTLTCYSGPDFEGAKVSLCQELQLFLENLSTTETDNSPCPHFDNQNYGAFDARSETSLFNDVHTFNDRISECEKTNDISIQNGSSPANHVVFDPDNLYISLPQLQLHVRSPSKVSLQSEGREPGCLSSSLNIHGTLLARTPIQDEQCSEGSNSPVSNHESGEALVTQSATSYPLNSQRGGCSLPMAEDDCVFENLSLDRDSEARGRENGEQHTEQSEIGTTTVSCPPSSLSKRSMPKKGGQGSQPNQRKRRRSESRTFQKSDQSYSNVLQTFSRLPGMETVERIFTNRLGSDNQMCTGFLTRMFYAIASCDAFQQLAEAVKISRQASSGLQFCIESADPYTLTRVLDELDATSALAHILRRYCLVKLLGYRNDRERLHQQEKRQPKRKRRLKYDLATIDTLHLKETQPLPVARSNPSTTPQSASNKQRADSLAVSDVMSIVYPDLKESTNKQTSSASEYARKRSKLKARLCCARNWYRLEQHFSVGILALIPCGGELGISIEQFEKLTADAMTVFLGVLLEWRGSFLKDVGQHLSEHLFDVLTGQRPDVVYGFEMGDRLHRNACLIDSYRILEHLIPSDKKID